MKYGELVKGVDYEGRLDGRRYEIREGGLYLTKAGKYSNLSMSAIMKLNFKVYTESIDWKQAIKLMIVGKAARFDNGVALTISGCGQLIEVKTGNRVYFHIDMLDGDCWTIANNVGVAHED